MKSRKLKQGLLACIATLMLSFGSAAQAQWSQSFDDVVNGVSGTLAYLGSGNYLLNFTIGDGAVIGSLLTAVDIKDFRSYDSFTFTAGSSGWENPAGTSGISAGPNGGPNAGPDGCNNGMGGFACIERDPGDPILVSSGDTFEFGFNVLGATGQNTDGIGAHVGMGFTQIDGTGNVGIVSVTLVPEPEIYAMLLAGLGLMGFVANRRRQTQVAA